MSNFKRTIFGVEGLKAFLREQALVHEEQAEHAETKRNTALHRGTADGFREALRAVEDTDFDRSPVEYEEVTAD